jgi:hypothetical protein
MHWKITADREELNAKEAREFFDKLEIKLSLTMAYNPEINGKSEWRHPPIVKALDYVVAICIMG